MSSLPKIKKTKATSQGVPDPPHSLLFSQPFTYEERSVPMQSGHPFYDDIAHKIYDIGSHTVLGKNRYPTTFHAKVTGDRHGRDFFYIGSDDPAVMLLLGEVGTIRDGCALGALGSKSGSETLAAQTAIRQRIRLRKPSLPTAKIDSLYAQQLGVLDSIPDYDETHDSLLDPKWFEMCKDKRVFSDEILFAHDVQSDADSPREIITVLTEPMYRYYSTQSAGGGTSKKRCRNVTDSGQVAPFSTDVGMSGLSKDITVGELHSSSTLSGYDHPALVNIPKGVVQFDMRDIDNNLICPADVPRKLRPGTLVLLAVCPVCWVFNETKRIKKHYALVMSSLRVLARSPEAAEDHSPKEGVSSLSKRKAEEPPPSIKAALDAFGPSPLKKERL